MLTMMGRITPLSSAASSSVTRRAGFVSAGPAASRALSNLRKPKEGKPQPPAGPRPEKHPFHMFGAEYPEVKPGAKSIHRTPKFPAWKPWTPESGLPKPTATDLTFDVSMERTHGVVRGHLVNVMKKASLTVNVEQMIECGDIDRATADALISIVGPRYHPNTKTITFTKRYRQPYTTPMEFTYDKPETHVPLVNNVPFPSKTNQDVELVNMLKKALEVARSAVDPDFKLRLEKQREEEAAKLQAAEAARRAEEDARAEEYFKIRQAQWRIKTKGAFMPKNLDAAEAPKTEEKPAAEEEKPKEAAEPAAAAEEAKPKEAAAAAPASEGEDKKPAA